MSISLAASPASRERSRAAWWSWVRSITGWLCLSVLLVVGLRVVPAFGATRPTVVAGQFYPDDPTELRTTIEGFLSKAAPTASCPAEARIVALIVPHAGYVYSGATAATGFAALAGQTFDRVCFLGVDHRSGRSTISVWPDGAYDSPLGPVLIDATFSRQLLDTGGPITVDSLQHRDEHSLEVLVPFYAHLYGGRAAAFVSVGGPPENGLHLGDVLFDLVSTSRERFLFIVSSDWSHYHDADTAARLDRAGIDQVLALNDDHLLKSARAGKTELCGLNGVLAATRLMRRLKGRATLLEQTDSSRASGDRRQVVGYAAILLTAAPPGGAGGLAGGSGSGSQPDGNDQTQAESSALKPTAVQTEEKTMTPESQAFHTEALSAVRTTLETYLRDGTVPALSLQSPRFHEICGVFVTLKKQGDLRGCIGLIQGVKPLGKGIQEMAIAAATEDPRFSAVTLAELKDIDIEISVLTPMTPVKEISEIQVGRDGLLLRRGYHSGLLLPQVPTEYGWDRDTFLEHLCYKAGLPKGSHLGADAQLLRFSAEVFGEKER